MSQTFEKYVQAYFIRCADVVLDCNYDIYGINEENVIDNTIVHLCEYHAMEPEEMITCMRLKIEQNMHAHHSPPLRNQLIYNNRA